MRCALLLLLGALSCAGPGADVGPKQPDLGRRGTPRDAARVRALDSTRLADVPAGTFGPYVADTAAGGVAVWAATDGAQRSWQARAFDAAGKPVGAVKKLGPAPAEVGLAVVEPRGSSGFALLYTRKEADQTLIEARLLGPGGDAEGTVLRIGDAKGEVIWIDLVPTTRGVLALFGVKESGAAAIFAKSVGGSEAVRAVTKSARAWQAASFGDGAALGFVAPVDPAKPGGGRVEVALLDDSGETRKTETISDSPTAEPDLDMVTAGRRLLFAWSDHRSADARIHVALADATGKLEKPPAAVAPGLGEQALVKLVPPRGSGPAYLAWENVSDRPESGRAISIAALGQDGVLGSNQVELGHASLESLPELVASERGLSALALGAACKVGEDCGASPLVPTWVELGRDMGVLVSAPVRMTALGGEPPDLAWGLSCLRKSCSVLAAQSVSPAPVYLVELQPQGPAYRPIASRAIEKLPPRATALETVASTEPLADLALGKVGDASLAAWVTYFDPSAPYQRLAKPTPDGRFDPIRARLQTHPLGGGRAEPETLSIRARSLGGVSLAAATGSSEALLGWTALDNKLPQVFATVVDSGGKKLRQRMLTRAPGEKSDVSIAALADGWILAWIDERAGDPELFALRLNRQLMNVGPEKRLTSAKGSAADTAVLSRGSDVWAAWSDAREGDRPGFGDIFVAKLRGADASLDGAETRIEKTALHSRSPALASFGKGALLAWIEETPATGGAATDGQIKLAVLDEAMKPSASSTVRTKGGGTPGSVALDCGEGSCRVIVLVTDGEAAELQGFVHGREGSTEPKRLVTLSGYAGSAVPVAIVGDDLIYAERSGSAARVRRLSVDWGQKKAP